MSIMLHKSYFLMLLVLHFYSEIAILYLVPHTNVDGICTTISYQYKFFSNAMWLFRGSWPAKEWVTGALLGFDTGSGRALCLLQPRANGPN